MTERERFLASIAADPEDNTRRLAYADWCRDAGDHDRADLIHLQMKIADLKRDNHGDECTRVRDFYKSPESNKPGGQMILTCHRCTDLQEFEYLTGELFAAHPDWKRLECPECGGKGTVDPDRSCCRTCIAAGDLLRSTGTADPDDFDIRGHTLVADKREVTFSRGFIASVGCLLDEVFTPDGKPKPWALAVCERLPVESLVIDGPEAYEGTLHSTRGRFAWFRDGANNRSTRGGTAVIPFAVFEILKTKDDGYGPLVQWFDSRDIALSALHTAAATLVRQHLKQREATV